MARDVTKAVIVYQAAVIQVAVFQMLFAKHNLVMAADVMRVVIVYQAAVTELEDLLVLCNVKLV